MSNNKVEKIRVFPEAKQIEFSVIALLLKHKDNIELAKTFNINENWFYNINCKNIFKAINSLKEKNGYVDINSVYDELNRLNINIKYDSIKQLIEAKVEHSDVLYEYLPILKDYEIQRQLLELVTKIEEIALTNKNANEKISLSLSHLNNIITEETSNNLYYAQKDFDKVIKRIEENKNNKGKNGLQFGFHDVDFALGGINTGLHIIAARPGVGKTSFLDQIIDLNADKGHKILFFSVEMNYEEVMFRKIQRNLFIDTNRLRRGDLFENEYERILDFKNNLNDNVIYYDVGGLNIDKLISIAKIEHAKGNLSMIAIDYLQLLRSNNKFNRYEEITDISIKLKNLSKELKIPVVSLAQLNRNAAKEGVKPSNADIRESGQIEQDADSIIFLHRAGMYDKTSPHRLGGGREFCEIIVSKNRFGSIGEHFLIFNGPFVKFEKLSENENPFLMEEEEDKNTKKKEFKLK